SPAAVPPPPIISANPSGTFSGPALEQGRPRTLSLPKNSDSTSARQNQSELSLATHEAPRKETADTWVQNGKLMYESGRLDDAEANLTEAIKLDPQNKAAFYYFNLVRERRHRAENLAREDK